MKTPEQIRKSNAERQARLKERKSHRGLFKRRYFYVHPDDYNLIYRLSVELQKLRLGGKSNEQTSTQQ